MRSRDPSSLSLFAPNQLPRVYVYFGTFALRGIHHPSHQHEGWRQEGWRARDRVMGAEAPSVASYTTRSMLYLGIRCPRRIVGRLHVWMCGITVRVNTRARPAAPRRREQQRLGLVRVGKCLLINEAVYIFGQTTRHVRAPEPPSSPDAGHSPGGARASSVRASTN